MLVNNADVMPDERQYSPQRVEMDFAAHVLAPWVLINDLAGPDSPRTREELWSHVSDLAHTPAGPWTQAALGEIRRRAGLSPLCRNTDDEVARLLSSARPRWTWWVRGQAPAR